MRETWVRFLGREDPMEKGKAAHSIFWPGEFQGLHSSWGRKESDTTEQLSLSLPQMGQVPEWVLLSWVHRPPQGPRCSFPRRLRECSTSWTLGHSPVSRAPELDILHSIPRPLPYHCNSFKNTGLWTLFRDFQSPALIDTSLYCNAISSRVSVILCSTNAFKCKR